MQEKELSWKEVKKLYEKKFKVKLKLKDWNSPELVMKYIEKWELDSSSAEIIFSLPRKDKTNSSPK